MIKNYSCADKLASIILPEKDFSHKNNILKPKTSKSSHFHLGEADVSLENNFSG
ncbi:MAG: hypothetical protein IKF93_09220 [Lachnospiraceae bacterium]|nr:hypothetical protein [Lachnospiraceae bacterium]